MLSRPFVLSCRQTLTVGLCFFAACGGRDRAPATDTGVAMDGAIRADAAVTPDATPDAFVGDSAQDASDSNVPEVPIDCSPMGTWEGDYAGDGTDLIGYREVTGDVLIAGHLGIVTMTSLACLETVGGDLILGELPDLLNLDGLESLKSVAGTFQILNARRLSDISALAGLTSVRRIDINQAAITHLRGLESISELQSLRLSSNLELTDIQALSAITEYPGGVTIAGNTRLSSLAGLGSCVRIGGMGLNINGNAVSNLDDLAALRELTSLSLSGTALSNISGLRGVTRIDEGVQFWQTGLTDLNGLQLTEIGTDLTIRANPRLTGLRGLESLTAIGRSLFVNDNEGLIDTTALQRLTSSGGVWFEGNRQLPDINGLTGLTEIDGNLVLIDNATLRDLGGLRAVTSITGHVRIERNPSLTTLTGLDALETVDEYMTIQGPVASLRALASLRSARDLSISGTATTSLSGLEALTTVNRLSLTNNDALTDLRALALREAGTLSVSDNDALVSLAGLEELEFIRIRLSIQRNRALTSVAGLEGLTSIGDTSNGDLDIQGNVVLANLRGLRFLTRVRRGFLFRNNVLLCRSEILALLSTINDAMDPDLLVPPSHIMGNRPC
ncbi:MAG: hypothetical protein AAGF12_23175 [Myxococcota bacterium]